MQIPSITNFKPCLSFLVPLGDVESDAESDHDYEIVEDTLVTMMKKAQENVIFY